MRASWHDFSRGLWVVSGKEQGPQGGLIPAPLNGFMRRARGMYAIRTPSLRTRDGSTLLFASITAIGLFRFNDLRFAVSATTLYRNGVSIQTGLNGGRPAFVSMPPQTGLFDWLFLAGTGNLIKVDTGGGVQKWGIAKPNSVPALGGLFPSRSDTTTVHETVMVKLARANGYRVFDYTNVEEFIAITGPTIPVVSPGAGLATGTYKYKITFKNTATGSRSNPQESEVSFTVSIAGTILQLSSIPLSGDPQVNAREIYRTQANGQRYFLLDTILDNTTTTYSDGHPDADLGFFEVQLDNDPPENTYRDAWSFLGTMWWTRDSLQGAQGRAYYSPPSRPESVLGFVEVTNPDDPCQKGVSWGGQNWVFTEARLFRINGTEEPFLPEQVFGVPGTIDPFSVAATPFGIVYKAMDGFRLFNGTTSTLIGYDQIGPLFRGRALENLSAWGSETIATYSKDEYVTSDGTQTLAISLKDATWRDLGVACTALYQEQDTRNLLASFAGGVYSLEDYGTNTDGAEPLTLEWELGAKLSDISQHATVQRVYIDIDTHGQTLTPTLLLDNTTTVYPVFIQSGRGVIEWSVNRDARIFSLRMNGTVSDTVELFGVELDFYVPEQQPSLGRG